MSLSHSSASTSANPSSSSNQPPITSLPFPLAISHVPSPSVPTAEQPPIERSDIIFKLLARGFVGEELEKEIKRREEAGRRRQMDIKEEAPPPISLSTRPSWVPSGSSQLRQHHSAPAGPSAFIAPEFVDFQITTRPEHRRRRSAEVQIGRKAELCSTYANAISWSQPSLEDFECTIPPDPNAECRDQISSASGGALEHSFPPTNVIEVGSPSSAPSSSFVQGQSPEDNTPSFSLFQAHSVSPPDQSPQSIDFSWFPLAFQDPSYWASFANPQLQELVLSDLVSEQLSIRQPFQSHDTLDCAISMPNHDFTASIPSKFCDTASSTQYPNNVTQNVEGQIETRDKHLEFTNISGHRGYGSDPGPTTAYLSLQNSSGGHTEPLAIVSNASYPPSGHLYSHMPGFDSIGSRPTNLLTACGAVPLGSNLPSSSHGFLYDQSWSQYVN